MADEVKNSLRRVIGLFVETDPNNNKQSPEGLLESLKIEGRYEEEIFASKKAGTTDNGDTTRHHSQPAPELDSAEINPSPSVCMTGLGKKVTKLIKVSLHHSTGYFAAAGRSRY